MIYLSICLCHILFLSPVPYSVQNTGLLLSEVSSFPVTLFFNAMVNGIFALISLSDLSLLVCLCVCVCVYVCVCRRACSESLSCVQFFVTPWTVAHQAPLVCGNFQARILEWLPFSSTRWPFPPGIKSMFLASTALVGRFFTTRANWEAPTVTVQEISMY